MRVFYTTLVVLIVVAVAGLALFTSLTPALFALGFNLLIIGVIALMADADADEGTHALVRDGRLTKTERRVLVVGFVCTFVAAITCLIEVKSGLRGDESGILAVIFATATGLFAFVALIRD